MMKFLNLQTDLLSQKNGRYIHLDIENHIIKRIEFSANPVLNKNALPFKDILQNSTSNEDTIDCVGFFVVPPLVDAHVHSRDPGLTKKETWSSMAKACLRGGVRAVIDMPNTIPPTFFAKDVEEKIAKAKAAQIAAKCFIGVGGKNIKLLSSIWKQCKDVSPGFKIYFGSSTGDLLFNSLESLNENLDPQDQAVLVFHSEDQCVIEENHQHYHGDLPTKQITRDQYKDFINHSRIRSSNAALTATKKILAWAEKTNFQIHMAHVSCPEELELCASYRKKGVRVTTEVAPHHLLFSTDDYEHLGPFLKVNPPVRSLSEVKALRELVGKGFCDIFATDHAPHLKEEKLGMMGSEVPSGLPSLEFALTLIAKCAELCHLPLDKAISMYSEIPATIFGFKTLQKFEVGQEALFSIAENKRFQLQPNHIHAFCGWSPYENMEFDWKIIAAYVHGLEGFMD